MSFMMYERKILNDADASDARLKLEMMKLDFFAKIITGQDLKLSEKWNEQAGPESEEDLKPEEKEEKIIRFMEKHGFVSKQNN